MLPFRTLPGRRPRLVYICKTCRQATPPHRHGAAAVRSYAKAARPEDSGKNETAAELDKEIQTTTPSTDGPVKRKKKVTASSSAPLSIPGTVNGQLNLLIGLLAAQGASQKDAGSLPSHIAELQNGGVNSTDTEGTETNSNAEAARSGPMGVKESEEALLKSTLGVLEKVLLEHGIKIDDLRARKPRKASPAKRPRLASPTEPPSAKTAKKSSKGSQILDQKSEGVSTKAPTVSDSAGAMQSRSTSSALPKLGLSLREAMTSFSRSHGVDISRFTALSAPVAASSKNPKPISQEAVAPPRERSTSRPTTTVQRPVPVAPAPGRGRGKKQPTDIKMVNPGKLALKPVDVPQEAPVPTLSYGLDRVLFNPGVYHLQDPRSRVYNFDPYLANIMPTTEFDYSALKDYVTSSKDDRLRRMASETGAKYAGSTSSMTAMLSHFHFLLSSWRPIHTATLSQSFEPELSSFTQITRAPAAAFLHWNDGTYAIDADKQFDTANILSMLGKSMEKLLTLPRDEYEKYRRSNSKQLTEEEKNAEEAYHFTTMGDFLMRSQLDAQDPRLPGTGAFDLKTRSVVSIRLDTSDIRQRGVGYEIFDRFGEWESFEREYYDMIRAAFLKYSLQVRMGRMDGIFVAFHNTQRIFGFQYISLDEMDVCLHGGARTRALGDEEFKTSLHLLNEVLNRATARFPGRSLRLFIETRGTAAAPFTYVFAKPVTPQEISAIQDANKASFAKFERKIMGLYEYEAEAAAELANETEHQAATGIQEIDGSAADEESTASESLIDEHGAETTLDSDTTIEGLRKRAWEEMERKVDEAIEDDDLGIGHVREAIEDALEESGLLRSRSPEETEQYVKLLLESLTGSQDSRSKVVRDTPESVEGSEGEIQASQTVGEVSRTDEARAETSIEDHAEEELSIEDTESSEVAIESALDTRSSRTELDEDDLAIEDHDPSAEDPDPSREVSNDGEPRYDPTLGEGSSLTPTEESDLPVPETERAGDGSSALPESNAVQEAHKGDDVISVAAAEVPSVEETEIMTKDARGVGESAPDVEESEEAALDGAEPEEATIEEPEDGGHQPAEAEDPESVMDEVGRSDKNSSDPSLKDLIQRLAEQVEDDAEMSTYAGAEHTGANFTRLENFERILSGLVSTKARADVVEPEEPPPQATEYEEADNLDIETAAEEAVADQFSAPEAKEKLTTTEAGPEDEILGLVLTVRNKQSGKYVLRPEHPRRGSSLKWEVEYAIEELPLERAARVFQQCQGRRKKILRRATSGGSSPDPIRAKLEEMSRRGHSWRRTEDSQSRSKPLHVYGDPQPQRWDDVFRHVQEERERHKKARKAWFE